MADQYHVFRSSTPGSTYISKDGTVHRFHRGELRVNAKETVLLEELRGAVRTSAGAITEDKGTVASPTPAQPDNVKHAPGAVATHGVQTTAGASGTSNPASKSQ